MKHLLIILAAAFISFGTYAQKREVTATWNHLKYGDYDLAKKSIDKAVEHESTKNEAKTWYFYAKTYHGIHISKKPKFKSLDDDAANKAFKAYIKFLRLNFKDESLHKLDFDNEQDFMRFAAALQNHKTQYYHQDYLVDVIQNQFPPLANAFVNMGVEQFKEKKEYEKAYESFSNSLFISSMSGKLDTPIVYYAALAAEKAEKYDEAMAMYENLAKLNYGKDNKERANIYYYMASIYKKQENNEKYLESLNKGIEKYPEDNSALIAELINYYLGAKKSKEALDYLNVAIEKTPDNATFHFAKGSLLESQEKPNYEEAEKCYKKAIELDAEYLDPVYNLGALYYNVAADLYEQASAAPAMEDYEKFKKQADEKMQLALPYMEKAYAMDSEDANIMNTLKTIYYKLKMMDKYNEIKSKLE